MAMFSRTEDVWVLQPTRDELLKGAEYASVSMGFTFNRMGMPPSSAGQHGRAFTIAKGVVAQEALSRELARREVPAELQRKSHRDADLYDLRIPIRGSLLKTDVKTINHYSNYPDVGREKFSSELICRHRAYSGPDWRRFFPMLVPRTQIAQDKEAYIFAITSSIDFRRDAHTDRSESALTAFPYGDTVAFYCSKRLCAAREEAGQGFHIRCTLVQNGILQSEPVQLTIVCESVKGKLCNETIELAAGKPVDSGPMSVLSSFRIRRQDYDALAYSTIEVKVCKNELTEEVLDSKKQDINVTPDEILALKQGDFCNLVMPDHYMLHFLGWVTKDEYISHCRKYTGWVWPLNSVDKYSNQPWSRITDDDKKKIEKAGFADCIQRDPTLLKAGWLKTTGQGNGTCCYVYPNLGGANGGLRETNLYVLPQDLHTMDELLDS